MIQADFDTPGEACRFNDLGLSLCALICVNPDMRVSYSPVAAQRGGFLPLVGFPSGWCGGGLRTQERVCTTSL
ncbi:hypothetical protein [Bifidobacterium longum]|uniref:hypothetical protein n=1 Tax=Bifidobacterium longum TaxID=216816 RepID=UPI00189AF6D2|nr:hypothetical protein [Bifidobacterium longum]MDB6735029.1 hypothetical protein [Bifidobacterium longum]